MRAFAILFASATLVCGCQKSKDAQPQCVQLRTALLDESVTSMTDALSGELNDYSKAGLGHLASEISAKCNLTASLSCFDCIYTQPAESEMKIIITTDDSAIVKMVDLSRASLSSSRTRIVSIYH